MPLPILSLKNIQKLHGTHAVLHDLSLEVYPGEFLTLLGPSGCGKTTLLRLIAGFDKPDHGDILFYQKPIQHLPPQSRDLHTVFQTYALFPHLSVFENVAFALRCRNLPHHEIHTRVHEILELVQLLPYAHRSIHALSGGQQQRVAIARAIINRPKVLLLDEPLSSLDYQLRKNMQRELKQLQKTLGMTFIFVTHDQEEALAMSDRIAVLNQGHIEQIGTPREIYETPCNLFVAMFIGAANIFDVTVDELEDDHYVTILENTRIRCKNTDHYQLGENLHLMIRPEDIRVWSLAEVQDHTYMLPGKIVDIIYKGSTVDLTVALPSGQQIYASEFFDEDDDALAYQLNESVWVAWFTGWEVSLRKNALSPLK